jgi:MoaA/NifB/PqqE/SkfB family radical SAM enzyme
MLKDWYSSEKYALHIELTNICNAACPICPRYVAGSKLERPDLIHTSIGIDQYKEWFTPEFLQNQVGRIMLCGNQGDPMATKDIVPIIEYTLSNLGKDAAFIIHSNAGLRSEKVWREVGKLIQGNQRWFMYFSIDGLEDTNHIYRRNVEWQRVMRNAKAFLSQGGNAIWDFLVFKHNEHQIDEVKKLSTDMGFMGTRIKLPDGLYENGQLVNKGAYDKQGNLEHLISPSSIPEFQNAPTLTPIAHNRPPQKIRLHGLNHELREKEYARYEKYNITCKSLQNAGHIGAEIFIAQDGLVLPCCFIGELWQSGRTDVAKQQLQDIFDLDKMYLQHNSIDDIFKFFDDNIITSWNKKDYSCGKSKMCSKVCGDDSSITRLIYEKGM